MENLLYAPLQISKQRKEVSMVSHDAEDLYGEKTMMFSADDADIDVTHSQTVMITNDSDSPYQDGVMLPTCANIDFFMSMDRKKAEPCTLPTISSSSVRHFDLEFEKPLANFSKPSLPKDNSMLHKVGQSVSIQSKDVHCPDDSSQNDSKVTGPPEGWSPNHSGSRENLGDHFKNRLHGLTAGTIPNFTSTFSRSMFSLDGKVTRVSDLNDQLDASQNDVKSIPISVNKNSPGNANAFSASPESATMQKNNGSDSSQENCSLSCGLESAPCITAAVDGVDDTSSTKSRRLSLADLRFKIRRMSRLVDEPTERIAVDVCDATLSQPKSASDGISDKTHLTALQHNPETQTTDNADYTQPEQSAEEQQPCVTAPLKLNRRSLSSRLSMGNLLPKRPRRSCRSPGREHDYEVDTHQLSSGMRDNIVDEVLPNISSEEDTSMVNENPQSTNEDGSSLHGRHLQGTSEEVVWELSPGHPSDSQCEKTSPVDGKDMMAAEKRRRISSESNIETSPEKGKCIGTFPLTPAVMAKAKDVSKRSTSQLRSETTFESTLKQSLFESQLEGHMDYTNDFQKNVEDESITVSEFFQLLNIDFVIHNPRQSILPGKLASHLGHTPENLLKNRHIHHPKQMVYEAEHKNLAEKVERLKAQMKDQARLLHTVNQPLWEELKCFSEDELKIFGSKMKERIYFFRKRSKAQSHEMKEALYSNLLQANLEERQRLRGKTEEADGMLKSLDDCIQELETELAAVEENGSGDGKLTLKSGQLGLEKVRIEIAEKERQMCEMEMQKKCNVDQVKRLQVEIQDLNGHFSLLHRLNEWKLAERRAVYSFLYGSLLLEVVFDTGADQKVFSLSGEGRDERNILDINFKLELDEEKSECHARLVHTLVSDFISGQSHWVGKYLSSRCVPKLLHDVALVVSRLRLLGEEVRLLRTWGSLKFNISDIRCVGKRVHIVFSSLEAMAEFELSLAVTTAYPCSPLQLQDFKNHIGLTSVCRLEEIVSSVSPDKNYLTRIVKAIHAAVHS
ncbi:kinetochore scaffold 1-like isoform X2 [Gadus chalcogrammus]|nr:kinetochore scaffold 1-like isoform X2 [Gadus chalcogrammus]XP_056437198.1 kinetochore scaffold 1-like isoform X2 [Gadus chalcogrammus]